MHSSISQRSCSQCVFAFGFLYTKMLIYPSAITQLTRLINVMYMHPFAPTLPLCAIVSLREGLDSKDTRSDTVSCVFFDSKFN